MAMQSVYSKEHDGIAQNPIVPWWSVSQPTAYVETLGHLKDLTVEHPPSANQISPNKQGEGGLDQSFTIFPGDSKSSGNVPKFPQVQATISVQPPRTEDRGHYELGFGQSLVCAKYPYGEQCYGVYSAYGPQVAGRIMLPLNLTSDEGPIFVNAKQYHGIIRRRKCRAKAEMENKLKSRKPYLHLSRHLHAMRRPRGCGGRFLNTRDSKGTTKSAEGQMSEETMTGSSRCKGSEVTSMFDREDPEDHAYPNLRASVHSLPDMMNTGRDFLMASKWVAAAAADSCYNLKV